MERRPELCEEISLLDGQVIQVPKVRPVFEEWTGPRVVDDYGGKRIVTFGGEPVFAEIAVLRLLEEEGWTGVWVDTYRRRYLSDMPEKAPCQELHDDAPDHLMRLESANDGLAGCWDVYGWRGNRVLFAEAKRRGHDRMRDSQRVWLAAGLSMGLQPTDFLVVEWDFKRVRPAPSA